jgi:hypothetical protein
LAGLVAAALVYGEIRLLTRSIWPAVLLHVGGNVLIGALVDQQFFSLPGATGVLMNPGWSSVISTVLFAATGLWLYRRRMASTRIVAEPEVPAALPGAMTPGRAVHRTGHSGQVRGE